MTSFLCSRFVSFCRWRL